MLSVYNVVRLKIFFSRVFYSRFSYEEKLVCNNIVDGERCGDWLGEFCPECEPTGNNCVECYDEISEGQSGYCSRECMRQAQYEDSRWDGERFC